MVRKKRGTVTTTTTLIIAVALFVATVVAGYGVGFIVYQPQISQLQSDLSQAQADLTEAQETITLLETRIAELEQQTIEKPEGTLSVSELLENPVYDTEVKIYGQVRLLGELHCPCFELTSGGRRVEVWYDLMVEDDGTEWPSVSVEGIENGDWVIVTGELKSNTGTAPGTTFFASNIERL